MGISLKTEWGRNSYNILSIDNSLLRSFVGSLAFSSTGAEEPTEVFYSPFGAYALILGERVVKKLLMGG